MANLTIRMEQDEKQRLFAWASSQGKNVTDYIKGLVAADMDAGTPESRAAAWLGKHEDALERIALSGVPGAGLALHHPVTNEDV